jgi:hypothetical protein
MNRSGKVEVLFLSFIAICLASYGVWKYVKAEETDIKVYVNQNKDLADRIVVLEKAKKELEELSKQIDQVLQREVQWEARLKILAETNAQLQVDLDAAQDHLAKMRRSQQELKNLSIPRHIEFNLSANNGPIPIEIVGGSDGSYPRPKKSAEEVKKPPLSVSKQTTEAIKKKVRELSQ